MLKPPPSSSSASPPSKGECVGVTSAKAKQQGNEADAQIPKARPSSWKLVPVVLLSCGFGLVLGQLLHPAPVAHAKAPEVEHNTLELFAKALNYTRNNYVDQVSETALLHGAVRGMVEALDDYSLFMPPKAYRSLQDDTLGEFGGIGIEVAQQGNDLVVLAALEESPAGRAGVRSGDLITAIDGKKTRGLRLNKAKELLKGNPGSKIWLEFFRDGFAQAQRLELVRERIRSRPIESRLIDGKVGYIRIKSFQDHTDRHFSQSLGDLRLEAGSRFAGLILDLRDNPGGLLDQGVKIADLFLSKGVIVSTRGRQGRHSEDELASSKNTEPDYPLVVLINQGSASASEIVAGALQDHRRGLLVGTRTFGKGSVQSLIELGDGSGLKLTVARYYTPSGRNIEKTGIEPDIFLEASPRPAPGETHRLPSHQSPYDLPVINVRQLGTQVPSDPSKTKSSSSPESATHPANQVVKVVESAVDPQDRQLSMALELIRDWEEKSPMGSR